MWRWWVVAPFCDNVVKCFLGGWVEVEGWRVYKLCTVCILFSVLLNRDLCLHNHLYQQDVGMTHSPWVSMMVEIWIKNNPQLKLPPVLVGFFSFFQDFLEALEPWSPPNRPQYLQNLRGDLTVPDCSCKTPMGLGYLALSRILLKRNGIFFLYSDFWEVDSFLMYKPNIPVFCVSHLCRIFFCVLWL